MEKLLDVQIAHPQLYEQNFGKILSGNFDVLDRQRRAEESMPLTVVEDGAGKIVEVDLSDRPEVSTLDKPGEEIAGEANHSEVYQNVIEGYKTPKKLVDFVDRLVHLHNAKDLKRLAYELHFASSDTEVREFISEALSNKIISEDESRAVLGFIESTEKTSGDHEVSKESDSIQDNSEEDELDVENIDEVLDRTRSAYADELVQWKNSNRQKKSKFREVLAHLGVERAMPKTDKLQSMIDTENLYLQIKKRKNKILGESILLLIEATENEYEILKSKILEGVSSLERGIVTKAFEKWSKLPMSTRMAVSTALMSGMTAAIGSVEAVSVATYAGFRANRSLAGESKGAAEEGSEVGEIEMNLESFAEKEKELTERLAEQKDAKTRERLNKAGAIIGSTSGITHGILTPALEENLSPSQVTSAESFESGQINIPIPFEGGKIDIVRGIIDNSSGTSRYDMDQLRVFLNGEEIATGIVAVGGAQVELYKQLRGGFFRGDTVYERAFKHIRPILKTLTVMDSLKVQS